VVEQGFAPSTTSSRARTAGNSRRRSRFGSSGRAAGLRQLGSSDRVNLFLESAVDESSTPTGGALGLEPGRVCVMIHTGSRGLGHQICTDHVRRMETAMARYGIEVPDRQLACVPVRSPEGEAYVGAMAAAANFARANRQLLTCAARAALDAALGTDRADLLYDVSHNLAKVESHDVGGRTRRLCVTARRDPGTSPVHPDLPPRLATTGQPVLVPGSMGTGSYVLLGVAGNPAFDSSAHGAGRAHEPGCGPADGVGPRAPARKADWASRCGPGPAAGSSRSRPRLQGRREVVAVSEAAGCHGAWPGWCPWAS